MGHVYASLTGTQGHFYVPGLNGTTLTIRNDSSFEVVSANQLDEGDRRIADDRGR